MGIGGVFAGISPVLGRFALSWIRSQKKGEREGERERERERWRGKDREGKIERER